MKKRLWWVLGIALCAVLLYSGYRVAEILAGYAQSEAARTEAVLQAVSIADEAPPAVEQSDLLGTTPGPTETPMEKPPITVNFDELRTVNPEIVGWLYCADTPINDPVAYTDNNTYYLNHLYNGETNKSGTLFVDCQCSPDFSDLNTVIYGHHMRSGAMFACLVKYKKQEYYDAHPVMYLLTPDHNYRLDVFSGYVAESGTKRFFTGPDDEADFTKYLKDAAALSDFDANNAPESQDRIVTLSTCTYEFHGARYILHAYATEIGG